ncbi:MAG TPA: hypothetical protein VN721_04320 [Flavipsychrobacter sp.]|nr:hypothetical protein [Flavipsychrobacter sp.]
MNGIYAAIDTDGNEIALIQAVLTWKILGFNYEVDVQDNYADEETTLLIPFLLTYCARHLRNPHYIGTI